MRAEWCIRVDGRCEGAHAGDASTPTSRPARSRSSPREIEVLSEAPELPLPVFGEPDYPEDTRLKYRFLDLRRETLHRNIMRRVAIIARMRELMRDAGFNEFQTPILTASSPEGARDFLVPSRIHPGKFYALPQAPQQFKQLIMIAGFDRYFQIAPCFRDEDPRADRLPGEFYQLDVEMSFVTQDDVFAAMEPVIREASSRPSPRDKPVTAVFPRIPYREAMRKYGSDKPDLRNPIEMQAGHEHFAGSGFKVFAGMIERDPTVEVWAIPAKGGGSRAFCDRMNSWAQSQGQPGLGYIFFREGRRPAPGRSPRTSGRSGPRRSATQLGLAEGDAVFFVAGKPAHFTAFAGAARAKIGQELGLIDENAFALAWIVDFPMYEWNEEEKQVDFSHNPFSMPQGGLEALETRRSADDPGEPVRHRLQRLRDRLGRDPQPQGGDHEEGLRDRRLRRGCAGGEVRRHASRAPVRRAAAWRHGGRRRPHRHAALRREEPARDHHVPDEPAGRRTS